MTKVHKILMKGMIIAAERLLPRIDERYSSVWHVKRAIRECESIGINNVKLTDWKNIHSLFVYIKGPPKMQHSGQDLAKIVKDIIDEKSLAIKNAA